ncbi:40S ribosomal protein S10 [Hondaea fermentalgiana]|uniref:40S ribosomal protein S10 n=1 Tax=Hondaea fermentalgiana TaxID=2315210 RepID=A0A2R5GNS9_9STRA|nr:40S ribosomal protein S10 [Hondaea fermentalgiana]|eukprot:GBG29961.1 40S ribosomal protein S10 [Hondaea fermentalgiana]
MLVSKKDRLAVYSHLFKEGVVVAQKDFVKPKHESIDVSNLIVIKMMTSLKSRGYVRETFNWQWYYWYLTEEGIAYLREFLHLPEEIVPQTHKKQQAQAARPAGPGGFGSGDARGAFGGDRYGERGGFSKDGGAGRDFNPRFRDGGFGRGGGGFGGDNYRREGGFGRGQ